VITANTFKKESRMHTRTRKLAIVILLLSSFLLSTITAEAQANLNDWSRLNSVSAGTKLSVKLKSGKTVKGKLNSVSDTGLNLTVKNAPTDIKREDVLTVHQVSNKSVGKSTLIGLGVGGGIGAVVGIAGDASSNDNGFEKLDNSIAGGIAVLSAAAGAIVGYVVGKTGNKKVLLYEAK
jgi:small nuclear ribonucleoprotein (snRNP)-like protein